ncbi:MAG TPA: phosphate ABC transporter permease PstA [Solirubrobacteraceae bacterium]|jgi:phosphate transport system permease protein|nr:phosphate ABC transporter permease PstA [Solirubrobacteraceae bacterium]
MTSAAQSSDTRLFDPTSPLRPSGNLRRRLMVSQLVRGGAIAAALVAVAALGIVTFDVVKEGAGALNLDFLIKDPPAFGAGGGIRSAIIGTAIIVGAGAVIATPLGILIALYLVEFSGPRSRTARALRMALDLMQGVPAIVVGIFVLGLIVEVQHKDSGFAGSVSLAIIMLPLVTRSSQEVLMLVPGTLREASDALGVDRWRSILTVILPTAMSGILTGAILAVARAAGETAPLLAVDGTFTPHLTLNWFGPMPNIPVSIWTAAEAADPNGFTRAWGMAFVLLMLILFANLGARFLFARSRRKAMG